MGQTSGVILLSLVLALWAAGFFLLPRFRACEVQRDAMPAAELSVIIPARDEERNLPKLLASLAAQDFRPLEIIVVNDGSTDRTAEVAREAGARVVSSEPLPEGWRGKTWACHQGAQAAAGGLLCFLDADTWFEAGGLKRVLASYQRGAFSVGPWHAVVEPHEELSLFFNLAMVAGTVPDGLFGQMLLVDRESYERVGGHESVRGRVLENFRLAEEFAAAGIPVTSMAGKGILSFRMYPGGLGDLIEGWTKGFASGAGRTSRGTLRLMVCWMSGLVAAALGLAFEGERLWWGVAYLLCAVQVGWFGRKIGGFGWRAALFYPMPLVFFFWLFARSARKAGKNVTWKGRNIDAS